jgi:hypothetical protein
MVTRKPHKTGSTESAVRLAVSAVEDSGRPLDLDAGDADTSPTYLGLPATQESAACPHRRCVCVDCGSPQRRD